MGSEVAAVKGSVTELIIDYLKQTPTAVAVLVFSYFCGNLWVYVVTTYKKKTKGNSFLKSAKITTSIGLAYFSMVMIGVYYLKFSEFNFSYLRILEVVIPTLILGLFLQLLAFMIFVVLGDER